MPIDTISEQESTGDQQQATYGNDKNCQSTGNQINLQILDVK